MAQKLKVELQDADGNIYYLHTAADVVYCTDGETVEHKLSNAIFKSNIINNCTSDSTDRPLAAAQGKTIWNKILDVISSVTTHKSSADHDGRYYTESEINTKLSAHNSSGDHDGRYYTESETDTKLGAKVTASGGDIASTKVSAFTESTASYPVPATGETVKVICGKVVKFFNDVKSGCSKIGDIVNNCTSTSTNKPLSAAQGKALMDKYNQLNGDKLSAGKIFNELWSGTWTSGSITVPNLSQYGLFMLVSSGYPVAMIGISLWGNDIEAYGVDLNASSGQRIFCLKCDRSNNTLSNLRTSCVLYSYGGQCGNKETFPITHIYGIV